jgi:glutamate 5-kinase
MQKVVIKIGSNALTQGTRKLSRTCMSGLAKQIAHLKSKGLQLALVSSGAVATGRGLLDPPKDNPSLSKRTSASIGQIKLMETWTELFSLLDLQVGQVLLRKDDFTDARSQLTKETLNNLLKDIIPIINENDTMAAQEACIGNNDHLAALVALVIEADTIILLTDQEGLYTSDPRLDPQAKFIPIVETIDQTIFSLAGGSSTSVGTGGMTTKLEAAQIAARAGIRTIIASSKRPNVLIDLLEGKSIGTLFLEKPTTVEKW